MSKKITKDTTIGELLEISSAVEPILASIGMFCFGCPSSQTETIAEAALVHRADADELVEILNNKIAEEANNIN